MAVARTTKNAQGGLKNMFKNNRTKRNSMPLTGIDIVNKGYNKNHQSTLIHVASRAIGVSEI